MLIFLKEFDVLNNKREKKCFFSFLCPSDDSTIKSSFIIGKNFYLNVETNFLKCIVIVVEVC